MNETLNSRQWQHVSPALWATATDEEKSVACHTDLAFMNAATIEDARKLANDGNELAASYVLRRLAADDLNKDHLRQIAERTGPESQLRGW